LTRRLCRPMPSFWLGSSPYSSYRGRLGYGVGLRDWLRRGRIRGAVGINRGIVPDEDEAVEFPVLRYDVPETDNPNENEPG
jgi:hypothetical protein